MASGPDGAHARPALMLDRLMQQAPLTQAAPRACSTFPHPHPPRAGAAAAPIRARAAGSPGVSAWASVLLPFAAALSACAEPNAAPTRLAASGAVVRAASPRVAPAPLARPSATARVSAPHTDVLFQRDLAPVFAATCARASGCHGDEPTPRVELDLRLHAARAALVGRPSEMRSGALLVDPGRPERSFVVDKLTGALDRGEGRPMPIDPETKRPVDAAALASFVQTQLVPWIAAGAPDN